MRLEGYQQVDVTLWENASGGKGIECMRPQACVASFEFPKKAGWYDLDVQSFDLDNGESTFRVYIGHQLVDEWVASDHLPATKLGSDSSTRRRISGLPLRPGDPIRVEGIPNREERAPLDYSEIHAK